MAVMLSPPEPCACRGDGYLGGAVDDLVDEAVVACVFGGEPTVAVGVALDLVELLAGVARDQLEEDLADVERLLRLNLDVGGRAAHAAGRLVHHDPRVREGVSLALRAGAEQKLAHRGREAHAERGDVVGDVLHRVVDRHAGVDRAAGRVDVEVDVADRVFGVEQQHLRADRVGVGVFDLGAKEDDALLEQPLVDVIVEPGSGRSAVRLDMGGVSGIHLTDTSGRAGQTHGSSRGVRRQRIERVSRRLPTSRPRLITIAGWATRCGFGRPHGRW